MSVLLNKVHPWRPVDWRYQKAIEYLDQGRRLSRSQDDVPTRELYFFLQRLREVQDEDHESRLLFECDGPWLAYEMHNDSDTAMRGIVQSRLLAGEPAASIGRKIGVKSSVIVRYAAYFFDIQGRLKFPDFIFTEVLSATSHDGTDSGKYELFLRQLGYFAGFEAIDQITHGVAMQNVSFDSVLAAKKLDEYASSILTQKCLAAIEQMDPANEKSVAEMLRLYARLRDVQNQGRNETSGHLDYLTAL